MNARMKQPSAFWMCPVCKQELEPSATTWMCAKGHSFDVAREGYVNLVPGGVHGKLVGDSNEMLGARRRFLDAGHYAPLRDKLLKEARRCKARVILEAGCGEGYYIGGIAEALPDVSTCGTDVARDAVRLAARKYPKTHFAVADTNRLLPLADGSVDLLLDIFAPRNPAEFARVVRRGTGTFIVVIPKPNHLQELRAIHPLMAIEPEKARTLSEQMQKFFRSVNSETLWIDLTLPGAALAELVAMTPSARTMTEEQRETLLRVESLTVAANFEVMEFVRN